ncbi:MAG: PIN/TRAM domain-containing protein [Phascolarctobacterium sp.]|nr:PIN/TRAM domain-containing protein [Phascolarctobacterium sp.]
MLRRIASLTIAVIFAVNGLILIDYILPYISEFLGYDLYGNGFFDVALANIAAGLVGLIFGWIGLVIAPFLINFILSYSEKLAVILSRIPTVDILLMILGIGIGLIIANLIGAPFSHLPIVGPYMPIAFSLVLSVVGAKVALRKHNDILGFFGRLSGLRGNKDADTYEVNLEEIKGGSLADRLYSNNKLLDTSVIIDGRIMGILAVGFLDGKLVVPNFVLEELQKLSDSSDGMKRAKGRRGLDLVKDMQKSYQDQVLIVDNDYDDLTEVDSKLVRLAKQAGAGIITNDFNLNKISEIQGIKVLNINELANAIKPIVISGEEMAVHLVKEGKEQGQAVAYLDDGTMIVVENARRFIGNTIDVVVVSVLQTAAGRMIFAKAK